MTSVRPHDLLRLNRGIEALPEDAPAWARDALARTPWVVVRRSAFRTGYAAVGVRGVSRAQRYATSVPCQMIAQIVTPEDLVAVTVNVDHTNRALQALRTVRPHLDSSGMLWGPTGSVGFELATGAPTTQPSSDLDILLRIDRLTGSVVQRLSTLHAMLSAAPARVDCQIESPAGAFALAELIRADSHVLVKAVSGIRLVAVEDLVL